MSGSYRPPSAVTSPPPPNFSLSLSSLSPLPPTSSTSSTSSAPISDARAVQEMINNAVSRIQQLCTSEADLAVILQASLRLSQLRTDVSKVRQQFGFEKRSDQSKMENTYEELRQQVEDLAEERLRMEYQLREEEKKRVQMEKQIQALHEDLDSEHLDKQLAEERVQSLTIQLEEMHQHLKLHHGANVIATYANPQQQQQQLVVTRNSSPSAQVLSLRQRAISNIIVLRHVRLLGKWMACWKRNVEQQKLESLFTEQLREKEWRRQNEMFDRDDDRGSRLRAPIGNPSPPSPPLPASSDWATAHSTLADLIHALGGNSGMGTTKRVSSPSSPPPVPASSGEMEAQIQQLSNLLNAASNGLLNKARELEGERRISNELREKMKRLTDIVYVLELENEVAVEQLNAVGAAELLQPEAQQGHFESFANVRQKLFKKSNPHEIFKKIEDPKDTATLVDEMMKSLKQKLNAAHLDFPFVRVSPQIYMYRQKKLHFSVHSGTLVVRFGAGFEDFLDFLEREWQKRSSLGLYGL